jgi:Dipeptidyl aminopeptidases/acylaminoacyl-peptidases
VSEQQSIEAFLELPGARAGVASPDGERVAFYHEQGQNRELCVLDVATGEYERLAGGESGPQMGGHLAWRGDGEAVLCHARRGPDQTDDIYAVGLDGGVRPVVTRDGRCLLTDVSADSRQLLFLHEREGENTLCRHDSRTGETVQLVTQGNVQGAKMSPDGERVAYTTTGETGGRGVESADVRVVNRRGENPVELPLERTGVGIRGWTEGRLLVDSRGVDQPSCGVIRLGGDGTGDATLCIESERWVGSDTHREHPIQFLGTDRVLAERVTERATLVPVVHSLTGGATVLSVDDGVADFAGEGYGATLADGSLLVGYRSPDTTAGLYRYDPVAGESQPLFEPDSGAFGSDPFVDAEHVAIESGDGSVGGILYRRSETGEPSPVVVRVSGSPRRTTLQRFDPSTQYLLRRGYSVLWVNQRGATRYLRSGQESLRGEFGSGDQRDIAAVADWLAGRDWVDESRLGITGRHYGGYCAYMQLLRDDTRFAAGVAWAGLGNLVALHRNEATDRRVRDELEQLLKGDKGTWRERSPVEHLERLRTPLAVVHAVEDSNIPVEQSRQMRTALRETGFEEGDEFEYHELAESETASRTAVGYQILGDFLDRRL